MQIRILGPLEVELEGRPVTLGPKQQTLLAILLVNRGVAVSAERIVEELYAGSPPANASKTLQVHVSRLRKALGENDRLHTSARGYRLALEPGEIDLAGFEQLAADGRSALASGDAPGAAESFGRALALWRGPALAEFAYADFAQGEIARLEELRLATLEDRIEADLASGRHAAIVGELEALVHEHPVRERLRGQLMLALYRSGRQAEALAVYQDARRVLVDELGIDPSRPLRDLQQAILAQDEALDLGGDLDVDRARTSDRASAIFVGREGELDALTSGLEDAVAGSGRLFLLVGEPGIGKSRLAEEALRLADERTFRVLVGRCWEAGGAPAYWPWVQALRACLRELDAEELRESLGSGAADLAQMFPELAEALPDLPQLPAPESEGARVRLFDATTALLKTIARDRPLVVFFDDLHAADEPSLLLLRYVAREIAATRILFLVAYRDVDPTLRDPLRTALSELVREPPVRRISLAGLPYDDVADYIGRVASVAPEARAVAAIHTETGGNPLFVGEIVRLLDSQGRLSAPIDAMDIPPEIHEVIGSRVARLSDRCRALLSLASVLGREFGIDVLQHLSSFADEELYDALDEAMVERIIGEDPANPNRLRFAHVLIRDTLYDELTAARRMQHHREAAATLELVHSSELEPHLAEIALHLVAAGPGSAARAVEYAQRAADVAAGSLAFEESARLYELALTLAIDDATRCELLLAAGDVLARAGDTPASKRRFDEAAQLADTRGLAEQLGHAALGYGGRILWEVSRDDDHLIPLLERALDTLPPDDSPLRARLLARLAGPLRDSSFPPERRHAVADEAVAIARRLDDPPTLAYALSAWATAFMSPGRTEDIITVTTELIALATEAGELERAAEGHLCRACPRLEMGDVEGAKEDAAAMGRLAEKLRQPSQTLYVTNLLANIALLEGDFGVAERLIDEALALGELAQRWNARVAYRLQSFLLRHAQGRLSELADIYEAHPSAFDYRTYPIFDCILARFYDELGRRDEARAKFEKLATDDFAGIPFDEEWLSSMCLLADLAASLDDARRGRVLYGLLAPWSDRVGAGHPEISLGAVARYLGLLASADSRWDDAERHFEDAIEINARIGASPWLAHTQEDYARMLRRRDRGRDHDRAAELYDTALAAYRELSMTGPLARATADDVLSPAGRPRKTPR
jgi:DNA-binding SARP family transcriptional activator